MSAALLLTGLLTAATAQVHIVADGDGAPYRAAAQALRDAGHEVTVMGDDEADGRMVADNAAKRAP